MNINHTFGTYIKDKRLAKQISLRKFAELLDISPVYLCNIEKDRNPAYAAQRDHLDRRN